MVCVYQVIFFKMNAFVILAFVIVAVCNVNGKPATGKYTTKYDIIDIDDVLRNDRLLIGYAKCLLNKGHCTPDGIELKNVLPDALKTECSKCSDIQRVNSRKVLIYLIDSKPEIYGDLEKIYDATGDYKKKYCAIVKEEGTEVKACEV